MKVYRIEREKYLSSTLSGLGASQAKGFRWNSFQVPLVYSAASRALALLEIFVHLDLNEDLPNDRFFVEIEIPDSVKILEYPVSFLPNDWQSKPPPISTQQIGDNFVIERKAAVLKVPSSIVPDEYNYLINPAHPQANKIKVISTSQLSFDQRLKR